MISATENHKNIKVIDSINKAMTKYSFDEIKKAIDNYAKVYNSDYFYLYIYYYVK